MKKREVIDRIKVGVFGLIGIAILTALVFYIGSNHHKIGKKNNIVAVFKDVSGLKKGNAIRFSGVAIGSVEKIEIIKDSAIKVTIAIDEDAMKYLKEDSKAIISTEGLLGSKYIKISGGSDHSPGIKDGAQIATEVLPDMDQLVSALSETGNNAKKLSVNLKEITSKINNGEGTIGALISDKKMYHNMNQVVQNFQQTGKKSQELTNKMVILVDTLSAAGKNTVKASENLASFTKKLNNDSSTVGKLLTDTTMANQLGTTISKFETAADEVTLTSNQVRNSWVLNLFSKNGKKKKNKMEASQASSKKK